MTAPGGLRIVALYAGHNEHGNDAGGAFIPQARGFARVRTLAGDRVELRAFDNRGPAASRRRAFLRELEGACEAAGGRIDALAYFGHGLRRSLPSAGLAAARIGELAAPLHLYGAPRLVVVLYACSAAAGPRDVRGVVETGDGGYADTLRDALATFGHVGHVDAHTVAGHTTINRYTRRFHMDGKGPGIGGTWLVAPGSPHWPAWGAALKSDHGLRFGFPFMDEAALFRRLADG